MYDNNGARNFSIMLIIVGALVLITASVVLWYRSYVIEQDCLQYLKQAANANTVEIASDRLGKALAFIDSRHWQEGNTGIFLTMPKNDVGFWIKNLRAAQAELQQISPDSSSLEKSNVLMKLRETLTDSNKDGQTVVVHPDNISLFPRQAVLLIGGILVILIGLVCILAGGAWFMSQ